MAGAVEPVRVRTAAGPVAVHPLGAGRPTVLWHGLCADASSWGYVISALLPGRRLLLVDSPGWGRSGRPRGVRFPDLVAAAADVVDAEARGPVDWVGNGLGARVGLAVAAERPGLVRSLVLTDADPAPMPRQERRTLRPTIRALRVLGPVGPIGRAIMADRLAEDSRTEPQTVGAVLDALLLAGRFGAARQLTRFDVRRKDVTGLLPRVTAPALLVAGDVGSRWPGDAAERAAALMPFARVLVVPEARALLPLDRPGPFGAAVRDFWASLD